MGCCLTGVLSPCQRVSLGSPNLPGQPCRAAHSLSYPPLSASLCLQLCFRCTGYAIPAPRGKSIPTAECWVTQPKWKTSWFFRCSLCGVTLITYDCNLSGWGSRGDRRGHLADSLKCSKSFWNKFHSLFLALVNVSQSPTCIYDPRLTLPSSLISSRKWATTTSQSLWCPPLAAWSCSRGNEMNFSENLCDKSIFVSQGRSIPG